MSRNIPAELILPDKSKSLNQGAINAMGWNSSGDNLPPRMLFVGLSEKYGFSMDTPWATCQRRSSTSSFTAWDQDSRALQASPATYNVTYEGIIPTLLRAQGNNSESARPCESFMRGSPVLPARDSGSSRKR